MLRKGKCDAATKALAGNQFGFKAILAFLVYGEIEKDNLVELASGEVQRLSPAILFKIHSYSVGLILFITYSRY
jgi:hypothetical protein